MSKKDGRIRRPTPPVKVTSLSAPLPLIVKTKVPRPLRLQPPQVPRPMILQAPELVRPMILQPSQVPRPMDLPQPERVQSLGVHPQSPPCPFSLQPPERVQPLVVQPQPLPRPLPVRFAPRPVPLKVQPSPRPKPWRPMAHIRLSKDEKQEATLTKQEKALQEGLARMKQERQQALEEALAQKKKEAAEKKRKEQAAADAALKAKVEEAHKEQQEVQKTVVVARKKATEARLQKWTQQHQKGKNNRVQRVPKLSALLAIGGPEADDYAQQLTLARMATWNANAGGRWQIVRHTFEGTSQYETVNKEEVTKKNLLKCLETFQKDPEQYLAFYFCLKKPDTFTYILRAGTLRYEPQELKPAGGKFLILRHLYKRLEPLENNLLPTPFRDQYTDNFEFNGKKLHSEDANNLPLLPGRGMGLGDEANMELMNHPQPSHILQGTSVGDCWLLSAIACLAEFEFAVERLFRNTPPSLPQDAPNQYTVTLWDLNTWKQVDVVVDERLPVQGSNGFLLGAKPSKDGSFWVPYLEKAIAAHCGGYDQLNGGNCTDAWPLLTGSRNQFVISKNLKTGKYKCGAKYNPQEQKWSEHSNSPHDSNPAIWQVDWPKVGGGGDKQLELAPKELFHRVVAWDENNYLIAAATAGDSDKESTDGLVDNHAYSVIDSRQNVCGTGIDLLLIRNPWGKGGELKKGIFMRSGTGWKQHPEIKKELNPVMEDNGLCWVTKNEFFQYFPTIYVCALNMTRLKDADYVNDLKDHFKRGQSMVVAETVSKPTVKEEETVRPVHIDKSSNPNSKYKIVEKTFGGGVTFWNLNKDVVKGRSIASGVAMFKANPEKYLAIHYQTNMVTEGWPLKMQQYTYIYRQGTKGLETDKNKKGGRTILMNVLK